MKKVILDETLSTGVTLTSNPYEVTDSATMLGLYIKYVKGTETDVRITVVHQDQVDVEWFDVSEISGGPGVNPILPYQYVLTANFTAVIPIPIYLRGDYRVVVVPTAGATGTIEISMSAQVN